MLPFTYTVIGAVNCPQPLQINAKSHRMETDTLLLSTKQAEQETYLEPLEWWRHEAPGFDEYLRESASEAERQDYWKNGIGVPDFAYTIYSIHTKHKVVVYADAHKVDGQSLQLALKDKIEAVFDRPERWVRHKNPAGGGLTDNEL